MARKKRVYQNRLDHDNLKTFKQHGFIPKRQAGGDEVQGTCIFCGSFSSKSRTGVKNSFYVNVESKKWDCKICGKHGGFQTFLREVNEFCLDSMTSRRLRRLSEKKSLRVATLKAHSIGFNPLTNNYIIPVYDLERDKILDLKIYDISNNSLITTAGCSSGNLYYGHSLNSNLGDSGDTVWLVEGHWDRMAMYEILNRLKVDGVRIVANPNAGGFKAEWTILFDGKDVFTVFDNDWDRDVGGREVMGAGKAGMVKVYNLLGPVVNSNMFIHWPESYKNGYDIRALYISKLLGAKRTLNTLIKLIKDLPPDIEKMKGYSAEPKDKYTGEGCPIEEMYDVFNKHLQLINNDFIDITYGVVLANRLKGSPIWLYLVGPSGCGKSEVIMSLDDHRYIVSMTTLTPSTLISGANFGDAADPSLIPKLDGKILAIKDFTAILGMNQTHQNEIVSLLRDAYDGSCSKHFGTGKFKKYKSKFGIIAGVTHIIDVHSEGLTALGERFIKFEFLLDESIDGERTVLNKVAQNMIDQSDDRMKEEFKAIGEKFLNCKFELIPNMPTKYIKRIIAIVQYCKKMRGSVQRHLRTGEITHKAMIEYGTRLTSNFIKLGMGLTQVHRLDEMGEDQYKILKHVAKATPPRNNEAVVSALMSSGAERSYTHSTISEMIGLPPLTTKMITQDLSMLGILKKDRKSKMDSLGNKIMWRLSDDILRLIDETELYGS